MRFDVDLGQLARNIDRVRERVQPAELMLVVKDNAYGHGLDRVVARAVAEGVRWFGAFDIDTALRVREITDTFPATRIFAWNPSAPAHIAAAVRANLDLGVGDSDYLEEVAVAARQCGTRARVHLKVDTGLHRNGVSLEQWPEVIRRAAELADQLEVIGVWSHIAEASDAEDDRARERFDHAASAAVQAGLPISLRHLAASAAAHARAEFRYDLVRVGAFCYGIRPAGGPSDQELGIQPAATLHGTVTAVTNDAVLIDIGSMDGIPSHLAGRCEVTTPGGRRLLQTINRTGSVVRPWPGADVGEQVVIFGADGASATDLAEQIDTIGEELVVRVSPRIPRRYRD